MNIRIRMKQIQQYNNPFRAGRDYTLVVFAFDSSVMVEQEEIPTVGLEEFRAILLQSSQIDGSVMSHRSELHRNDFSHKSWEEKIQSVLDSIKQEAEKAIQFKAFLHMHKGGAMNIQVRVTDISKGRKSNFFEKPVEGIYFTFDHGIMAHTDHNVYTNVRCVEFDEFKRLLRQCNHIDGSAMHYEFYMNKEAMRLDQAQWEARIEPIFKRIEEEARSAIAWGNFLQGEG